MICGECKAANIAQYIDVQNKIASTCRLHSRGLPQIYTYPNRRENVKINRKLYGDNPGHAKFNSCQIIFRLRNIKFYSHQNLLIYSSQLFSVIAINRKQTDVLLQN